MGGSPTDLTEFTRDLVILGRWVSSKLNVGAWSTSETDLTITKKAKGKRRKKDIKSNAVALWKLQGTNPVQLGEGAIFLILQYLLK